MGKDRDGKYHTPKGKPSDTSKEDALGLRPDLENFDEQKDLEITEKYTDGGDRPAPNLRMKNPNRNTNKKRDRTVEKERQQQDSPDTRSPKTDAMTTGPKAGATANGPGINKITTLDKEVFSNLAQQRNGPCISIYLSTHSGGMEVNEKADKHAFRDALQKAQQSLTQQRFEPALILRSLAPASELLNDDDFWRNQSPGLAVFLSPDFGACCQLPVDPGQQTFINTSFLLSPLASLLTDTGYAYVLVLSKHAAKIYRADRFTLLQLDIPELPNGMDDVVHFEEKGGDGVFRSAEGGHGGANFHGIGSGRPDDKTNIALYLKEVDRTLHEALLAKETAPLILAGVDYLLPIYRSVSGYRHICEEYLAGNYEHTNAATLYDHIRERLNALFDKTAQQVMAKYLDHTSLVNSFPQEVIRAAFEGRVAELYVTKGIAVWGRYEEKTSEPLIHEQEETGDENLADQAVVQTVLHGGKAHVVENMPVPGSMAAVLRY